MNLKIKDYGIFFNLHVEIDMKMCSAFYKLFHFTFFNSSSLWEKSTVSLWAAPDSTCIVMTTTLCPPLLCMTASNASFTSERCKNVWNTRKYMKDVYLPTNIFWTKLMMWNEYYKCNCKIVSLFFLYQFTKQKFYCTVVSMRLVQ